MVKPIRFQAKVNIVKNGMIFSSFNDFLNNCSAWLSEQKVATHEEKKGS